MNMVKIATDLRAYFRSARDQGQRPTCLAFALSDTHAAGREPHEPLSAEYLYYKAVQWTSTKHPHGGIGLSEGADALYHDGQPVETAWPYLAMLPADLAKWNPPPKLSVFLAKSQTQPRSFGTVIAVLDGGQPIVVIFRPSERFYYPNAAGFLPARAPDADLPQLHAVVAVAHGVRAGVRHLLVRNSWGTSWGQAGYGWLGEDYLSPRISAIASIQPR